MTQRTFSRPLVRALAAALVCAGTTALAAQQVAVFPSDHATRDGATYERRLPLSNGISRTQLIYEGWDLDIPAGRQITAVGFRQDQSRASTGQSIQLEIWMASTFCDRNTAVGSFDANCNGTTPLTKVFGPSIVRLPDLTTGSSMREVFIDLDTAFTPVAGENLLVEYRVFANSNANLAFNYYIDRATWLTDVSSFGVGCQSSAGTVPQLSGSTNSYLGGSYSISLSRAPANSRVWFNIALLPTTPIDMTRFGAPGCQALVFPQATIGATGTSSGSASLSFSLPADPVFAGVHLYSQVLVYDLFANQLGFVTSNGIDVAPGLKSYDCVIYAQGDPQASSGSVSRQRGIVSLFRHQ